MGTRREFLQEGFKLAALAVAAPPAFAASTPLASGPLQHIDVYKLVADMHSAPSRDFARTAARMGLATHIGESDITSLWFHDLYPRWIQQPVAIAGLTSPESLFCLERLAWDHGMKVIYKAQHVPAHSGHVTHRLTGSGQAVSQFERLYQQNPSAWASRTARILATFPSEPGDRLQKIVESNSADAPGWLERPLTSWLIAPATRG